MYNLFVKPWSIVLSFFLFSTCIITMAQEVFSENKPLKPRPTEVVVLGIYHLRFNIVGFEAMNAENLSLILCRLHPDIVAIEMNPNWLEAFERHESIPGASAEDFKKMVDSGEIGQVILPLAKKMGWQVRGITAESFEESEKQKKNEASLKNQEHGKGILDGFDRFISIFYEVVNRDFRTFETCNNSEFDRLMEIKHKYTSSVKYHYWETRNNKIIENIRLLARKNPGKRIVVTIGSEHGYALRQKLALCPEISHVPFLQAISR